MKVRPWVRYFARTVDVYGFTVIGGFAFAMLFPEFIDGLSEFMLGLLMVFSWMFAEALLLSIAGTTPGKWLFGIKLTYDEGPELTFSAALERSWKVWWRGMGAGLPLVNLITMVVAYFNLKSDGITTWDRDEGFTVTHEPLKISRIVWFVIALIVLTTYLGAAQIDYFIGSTELPGVDSTPGAESGSSKESTTIY